MNPLSTLLAAGWPAPLALADHTLEYLVEAVLAVAVVGLGWRLARTLGRRTRELQASERRWRELFEHASVAMLEEDFSAVTGQFRALRDRGVADLRAHLGREPALAAAWFRSVRVTTANRTALALFGAADAADLTARMQAFTPAAPPEAFAEQVVALWEGRSAVTVETGFTSPDGVRHRGLMRITVPERDGRPDHRSVLLSLVDLTEVRASEARFRALCEGAVEGIYESVPSGGFIEVNPAMARILGYASPAVLKALAPGQVAQVYVSPTRRDEFFQKLGVGDAVTDFESEIRRPDGTTCWIKENVRAVRDRDGRIVSLQGFVTDVTAHRRAETALRESEERYRQLFEQSPVAMVEIDSRETMAQLQQLRAEGVTDLDAWLVAHAEEAARMIGHLPIVGLNDAALRLLAAPSLAEVQANLACIFTPEAAALRRRALLAVWAGRNEVEGETRVVGLDGVARIIYQRWWVPHEGGRPLFERTQLASIDLTPIKASESALAAERERLQVTLRAMTEGVITVNFAGHVLFMNEAAGELTGWPPVAAIGRPLGEVCVLHHDQARWIATPSAVALAGDRPVDLLPQTILRPRAGGPRTVEGQCAPMHDEAGCVIGAVLVLRDVTARSRLESELLRASKLESVGVLAGGIAHDFNNLLAIIMGNLTLALLDEQTAAAGGRWLREAERGTMRAKELTQQLLTFAKGGEPVRAAVLLPDVVREAAEFALHGAAVRCEFDLAEDLRPADIDKGQIGQVVQNLVINAVQAMPAGGVIRLGLRNETLAAGGALPLPAGDYLRLEIADTGAGIPPELLTRIFEPFYTTKEHGSGLGLATVYSVIQKHRGHVTVESTVGTGTTFRLWLPAARVEPAKPPISASPFEAMRGRVLFMDDEESIREMTKALLERLGLEAVVTADGGEAVRQYALAQLAGRRFDVVIMDLTVPGAMGGAEAMREILKIDPAARGIVSSGYSSDPVLANYRAHGFRGMVPKPYRIADFSRTLREVLVNGTQAEA